MVEIDHEKDLNSLIADCNCNKLLEYGDIWILIIFWTKKTTFVVSLLILFVSGWTFQQQILIVINIPASINIKSLFIKEF